MEATVATREVPPEAQPSHDGKAEATRSSEELFEWSGYVHVGKGAEECLHAIDGECTEKPRIGADGTLSGHFHAWVCLPNQFQIRDIGDKARAARARKTRALRDPQSDSYAILEAELDDLRYNHFDELVDSLAHAQVNKDLLDIVRGIEEDERFEHHAQDVEELNRLHDVPEDERDAEEYERLQADALAYSEELQRVIDERHKAEVARLRAAKPEDVIDLERRERIDNIGTEMYLHTYYTWAMYVCARKPVIDKLPTERVFAQPEDLRNAADEVVVALRSKISQLENRTVRGDAAGNS
jgi:hypothetical protein